jgi:hypothetical protein
MGQGIKHNGKHLAERVNNEYERLCTVMRVKRTNKMGYTAAVRHRFTIVDVYFVVRIPFLTTATTTSINDRNRPCPDGESSRGTPPKTFRRLITHVYIYIYKYLEFPSRIRRLWYF